MMAKQQADVVLYTTPGCHLCEQAEEILYETATRFRSIDIADDVDLIKRYGVRIPVVADEMGRELSWPFDSSGLKHWVSTSQ